jgi:hypothetical protein
MPAEGDPVMELGVESAICVWDYDHLPESIKDFLKQEAISTDDADWFALKPAIYQDDYIPWLEEPQFGCCLVQEHPIGTIGYTLVVGYHS